MRVKAKGRQFLHGLGYEFLELMEVTSGKSDGGKRDGTANLTVWYRHLTKFWWEAQNNKRILLGEMHCCKSKT